MRYGEGMASLRYQLTEHSSVRPETKAKSTFSHGLKSALIEITLSRREKPAGPNFIFRRASKDAGREIADR